MQFVLVRVCVWESGGGEVVTKRDDRPLLTMLGEFALSVYVSEEWQWFSFQYLE